MAISISGALAQTQILANSAQNTANLRSTGAIPGADGATPAGKTAAFQPQRLGTAAVTDGNGQGIGTRVVARPGSPAFVAEYQPDDRNADADGRIAAPNLDLARERVEQIGALRAFQANLAAIRTQDQLERSAIDQLA